MLFPSTFSLILNFPWLGGAVVFASPNAYRGCPNFSFEILDRKPSWCSRVVKLRRRYASSSPADLRNPWKPLGYTLPGTLFLVIFFFKIVLPCLSLILLLYSLVGCSCPLKRLYCLCILNHICLILKRKRKFENLKHRVRRPRARHVISRKFFPNFFPFFFFWWKITF